MTEWLKKYKMRKRFTVDGSRLLEPIDRLVLQEDRLGIVGSAARAAITREDGVTIAGKVTVDRYVYPVAACSFDIHFDELLTDQENVFWLYWEVDD
jgi:hypothetical protein